MSGSRGGRALDICEQVWDGLLRADGVEAACAGDPPLMAAVLALLSADRDAGEFLESPPAVPLDALVPDDDEAALPPGTRVGRFTIDQFVARGGMGAVYRAMQDQPARAVALKILRTDPASSARVFIREVEALGRLAHPGVAQVYEAGIWQPSDLVPAQPYIAMEFVDGAPITDFCASACLPVERRVSLFLDVCDAVEHAHRKAIIHRDLKPSNILVAGDAGCPTPKVIDFGIARLTEADPIETLARTESGRLIGTLLYMSPEQIHSPASGVDTRSDVYALGIILYELLAGCPAFDVERGSLLAALRAATEGEPIPLRRRAPSVPRDLEAIVTRAIRKRPEQRYQSVAALAEDLDRWRRGEPVVARPPGRIERTLRYARRHKALTGATVGVIAALTIGIATTSWQAVRAARSEVRANHRLADLRSLTNSLIFELHDSIQFLPGATEARLLLVERGLQFLDQLERESGDDPGLLRDIAEGYHRIAMVQQHPLSANIGDAQGAVRSIDRAVAVRSRLVHMGGSSYDDRRGLGQDLKARGVLYSSLGRTDEAVDDFMASIGIGETLLEDRPNGYTALNEIADYARTAALTLLSDGHADLIAPIVDRAATIFEVNPDIPVLTDRERRFRGLSRFGMGAALGIAGRVDEALTLLSWAVDDLDALAKAAPDDIDATLNAGDAFRYRAGLLADLHREADAVSDLSLAIQYYRSAVAIAPNRFDAMDILASTLTDRAKLYAATADYDSAVRDADEALDIRLRLVEADPADKRSLGRLVKHRCVLAEILVAASTAGLSPSDRLALLTRARAALDCATDAVQAQSLADAPTLDQIDALKAHCDALMTEAELAAKR